MTRRTYPNEETRLFFQGQNRLRRQWKEWAGFQAPIIMRLIQKAERFAMRKRFREAKKAAWDAMQAILELDSVWMHHHAQGNTFIKTVPKGWEKFKRVETVSNL